MSFHLQLASHNYSIQFRNMATVKFAVVDANDFLSKKQTSDPELATDWAKLEEFYNKK